MVRSSKPSAHQLSLFPDHVRLTQIEPDAHKQRFYLMRTLPNLFGEGLLLREWGRIGSPGQIRIDWHPTEGDAINALAKLTQQKQRRGYAVELAP
ncbi:MAG: WGR domain-containing protein [Nitrospirota bacterium]|nr:WGR domain-containing protein [Nitrospirota bacterium]